MPFRNPILADEELIRPGIRSDNYVPGVSGWRITREGAAEFQELVVVEGDITQLQEDLAVALALANSKIKTFKQPTAPTSPPEDAFSVGYLWIDESSDNQLNRWDGDSWEPYQIGSTVIADAAILDAHILSASISKLTAGTLSAEVIIGTAIKTAAAGALSQFDTTGLRSFDNIGNEIIAITANNTMSSDTVLSLPGGTGNMMWTADTAALDITGDIDIRAQIAMDSWTPGTSQYIVGKIGEDESINGYGFLMNATNRLRMIWSPDGTWDNARNFVANAETGYADGTKHWVRGTVDMDNGAGGCTGTFYKSEDGVAWTMIGTPVNAGGVSSIFVGDRRLAVGARNGNVGEVGLAGKVYKAEVRNGINGTVVANPDFTIHTAGTTSFVDATGKTWTTNNDATIVAQPSMAGVPQIRVRNTDGSEVGLRPGSDDLGTTSDLFFVPPDLIGADWAEGRIAAGVDPVPVGDDRPVMRIFAPYDVNRGVPTVTQRATIALYGAGLVNTNNRINIYADKVGIISELECTHESMDTRETFEDTIQNPTNTASYSSGTVNCGHVFVAPMSGRIMVFWSADMRPVNDCAMWVGIELRTGTTVGAGTVVRSPNDDEALRIRVSAATHHDAHSTHLTIFGLTAGASYNIRTMQKVSINNVNNQINYRRITTVPQIG